MNPLNVPAAYVPFAKLKIGDTLVNNAQALVTIGGLVPLLIGDGPVLRVWLSVPSEQPGGPWRELIVDNVSSQPGLVVNANPKLLKVSLDKVTLLSATRNVQNHLRVGVLDLRPLGLDIFSDKQGFHVMGSTLTKAEFHGVPVIVACPGLV